MIDTDMESAPTATQPATETLVELLSHLIRFPTVTSDQATNRAAIDWVQQQLDGLPLHIKRHSSGGFASLTATTAKTKSPKLWLVAHIDVVPASPESFKPVVREGKLYGRGAHDMKFGLATFIALLQDLGDSLPQYDLGLMVTSDEEVGGMNGVNYLLGTLGYRGTAVLIPDCNANWKLETGAKGITWATLTAHGRTTHASRPWEGLNAIDELYRFVGHLRAHIPAEPCGDPLHQHTTLNLGTISGGTATNAVPGSASANIDFRLAPGSTPDHVTTWLEAAKQAVPTVTYQIDSAADSPYQIATDGPVKLFADIAESVIGHELGHVMANGSSDARFFAHLGIPTICVSPTGSGYHVPDEWVDIEDLGRFYEVTKRFASTWTK
jgi:succinyl-diaminopimelate desuccinylase